jgi:predicted transcriptional regulator of viral defense system
MTRKSVQGVVWQTIRQQHGVISRRQLLGLGFTSEAIDYRLERGRLHRVTHGVYAVGRPQLTQHGRWMAAVLSCGEAAVLSHSSAAALWGLGPERSGATEISVPATARPRRQGLKVHRRAAFESTQTHGIPVTTLACTFADIAAELPRAELEAAISDATHRRLTNPERLRREAEALTPRPGRAKLTATLDRHSFRLTRSQLERRFIPIAEAAGLPRPESCVYVNGFEVDFYFRQLRLIVEADSLRYHGTAQQQAMDRLRDHAHTVAGFRVLRFTHSQITYEPGYVRDTLVAVGSFHPKG